MAGRHILVTGASGMIGRAVTILLRSRGHRVSIVSRRHRPDIACDCSVVCDLTAKGVPTEALRGVDCIIHLAGDSGGDPAASAQTLHRINVDATRRLAAAAVAAGVGRFVLVSSIKVHGETSPPERPFDERSPLRPATRYARSRCDAERALREVLADSTTEWVVARPVAVFGPRAQDHFRRLAGWLERGWPLPVVSGTRRSLLSLDSAASALALMAEHPGAAGAAFVVADPEPLDMATLAAVIAAARNTRARLVALPGRLARAPVRVLWPHGQLARLVLSLEADPGYLIQRLGWQSALPVTQALSRCAQQW